MVNRKHFAPDILNNRKIGSKSISMMIRNEHKRLPKMRYF